MNAYDVDKLMLEARKIAAQYRRATGKPLGISSEIAQHDVMRLMELKPSEQENAGFDALGTGSREGRKIQIKGRTLSGDARSSQRIGQVKTDQEWDSVMLLLMDAEYNPVEIYEANREEILSVVNQTSNKRRHRGAMSVGRFKNIGRLVWSREQGKLD